MSPLELGSPLLDAYVFYHVAKHPRYPEARKDTAALVHHHPEITRAFQLCYRCTEELSQPLFDAIVDLSQQNDTGTETIFC